LVTHIAGNNSGKCYPPNLDTDWEKHSGPVQSLEAIFTVSCKFGYASATGRKKFISARHKKPAKAGLDSRAYIKPHFP
jgi:hypothetical protein